MPLATGWIAEGQNATAGGANAAVDPESIPQNQYWRGTNLSIRGGKPKTRPKLILRQILPTGRIQGGYVFEKANKLVGSIDGKLYTFNTRTFNDDVELTDATNRHAAKNQYAWFVETDSALIKQDDRSWPLVWDGFEIRQYTEDDGDSLPVGSSMSYVNSRLAVTLPDEKSIRIGDVYDGTDKSELLFTETAALLGGGDISFPSPITNHLGFPVLDTTTGYGSLVVSTKRKTYTVRTDITDRDVWASTEGFVKELVPAPITGPYAATAVNQDIFFRSNNGLRSIRAAVADYTDPGATPLSSELGYRFDYDYPPLLNGCSVVGFDNRLFATHSPLFYNSPRRASWGGFISLNFDTYNTISGKGTPAYEGEWNIDGGNTRIVQMVVGTIDGRERCFLFCVNADGDNLLYEQLSEVESESYTDPYQAYTLDSPTSTIITRAFTSGDPAAVKALQRADLWVSEIEGTIAINLYFKPDRHPLWTLIGTWEVCAARDVSVVNGFINHPITYQQNRCRLTSTTPDSTVDSVNQWPLNHGGGFQFKIEWSAA